MEDIVRLFNRLPRPPSSPTGLPNHWAIGVRHVALSPPGDLVLAVNPQSHFTLMAGPGQILSQPTAPAKAAAVLPLLLSLFIKGIESPGGRVPSDPEPFAPWSWSADDGELAEALSESFKQHAVPQELHSMGVCSTEERSILDETWDQVHTMLMIRMGSPHAETATATVSPGDSSKCHGCGLDQENFSQKLMKCSACSKAFYHSQTCQRRHWKHHKPTCLANRSSPKQPSSAYSTTAPATGEAHIYYNTVARTAPGTQALLKALKLDPASHEGLAKPVRRLIITGQDSPENMELLFGPNWRGSVFSVYEEQRIEVLLDPPRGSPSHKLYSWLDDSKLIRSPRPATDAEQCKIAQVREMQETIRQRIGTGRVPSKEDMVAIISSFGPSWPNHLSTYMLAVNSMDQGRF